MPEGFSSVFLSFSALEQDAQANWTLRFFHFVIHESLHDLIEFVSTTFLEQDLDTPRSEEVYDTSVNEMVTWQPSEVLFRKLYERRQEIGLFGPLASGEMYYDDTMGIQYISETSNESYPRDISVALFLHVVLIDLLKITKEKAAETGNWAFYNTLCALEEDWQLQPAPVAASMTCR